MIADDSEDDSPDIPKFTRIPIPVGPLCPFRSSYTADTGYLAQGMDTLTDFNMQDFATEFTRIGLQLQTGEQVDKEKILKLADDLTKAEETWRSMLTRMRMSTDFQALEYFKLSEAWAKRQGQNIDAVGTMMRWQADNMRAFATGGMPTPPPPGIDLTQMMTQQGKGNGLNVMDAAGSITAFPFLENTAVFKSDIVNEEWQKLAQDHAEMIKVGEEYGSFDREGKVIFIDRLEELENRWDTFYSRVGLMGAINPDFEKQTAEYFEVMGMSNSEFRDVLAEAHLQMRRDADPLYDQAKRLGGFF